METIINNYHFDFLRFNNSQTFNKIISNDMLKSKNKINLIFDLTELSNKKIMGFYWKFHNFDSKIIDIQTLNNQLGYRNVNYYTLIQPYQQLPHLINDNIDEKDHIYMQAFCFHITEINNMSGYISVDRLDMSILTENEVHLNNDTWIELVVQYSIVT
jgi:hypothetical protein